MLTLGIDCATWTASVGLRGDGEVLAERSLRVSGTHAVHLLELVEDVLRRGGRRLDELDLIATSAGPGSFTGLRICLSTAKGLALVSGAAVVGVSTLEALATAALPRSGQICAMLDARKGEVYAAEFWPDGDTRVRRHGDDRAVAPGDLAGRLESACTLVGDGVEAYRETWKKLLPAAELVSFDAVHPRGAVVARLGEEAARRRGSDDLDRLEPRYCRKSEAEIHQGR